MSGGSFDYVCYKMADGKLDDFAVHAAALIAEIEKVAAKVSAGEPIYYDQGLKTSVPYPRTDEASVALLAAAARFRAALVAVEAARAIVREISCIAHAIEWSESGDTGPDDVADECIAWMVATAEATTEPPCE